MFKAPTIQYMNCHTCYLCISRSNIQLSRRWNTQLRLRKVLAEAAAVGIDQFHAEIFTLLKWPLNRDLNWKYLLPSGKLTKNYGKSPFFMGKSTINGHFQ